MKHIAESFHTVKLALAVFIFTGGFMNAPANSADISSSSVAPKPTAVKSGNADDLLDPTDAFRPKIRIRDAFTAELIFVIAPGYYLYRDRIRMELLQDVSRPAPEKRSDPEAKSPGKTGRTSSQPAQILALSLPVGRVVDDPTFGKVEIFETKITVLVDLSRLNLGDANNKIGKERINLALVSQGCAAAGVCFPPQKQEFTLQMDASNRSGNWVLPKSETGLRFSLSGLSGQSRPARAGTAKP